MKTIEQQLAQIAAKKKIGLMTHVVVGYPSLEETVELVKLMASSGVDFIELQIPFSDPLADGPTIMHANDHALAQGTRLEDCFAVMQQVSSEVEIPLLFMSYYHMLFRYGTTKFCQRAKAVGAQGLIIPDIPIDEEEHEHFIRSCEENSMHHIRLLSPTSSDERIALNAAVENGFVYCTSRSGITGASHELDPSLVAYLNRVRKSVSVPLAVGFGISKPEHVRALVGHAEVAVVGSAVIDIIRQEGMHAVPEFIKHLLSDV